MCAALVLTVRSGLRSCILTLAGSTNWVVLDRKPFTWQLAELKSNTPLFDISSIKRWWCWNHRQSSTTNVSPIPSLRNLYNTTRSLPVQSLPQIENSEGPALMSECEGVDISLVDAKAVRNSASHEATRDTAGGIVPDILTYTRQIMIIWRFCRERAFER